MKKNLDKAMPAKSSFVYGKAGASDKTEMTILKGKGDLRKLPGKNNGR